jgi:hypothetical protein
MGTCRYCGQAAGFLRSKHAECARRHDQGANEIVSVVKNASSSASPLDALPDRVKEVADRSFIPDGERHRLLVKGWSAAVSEGLHDHILTEEQEARLIEVKDQLSLTDEDLERDAGYERVAKSSVIRDLVNGVLPKRPAGGVNLPINFKKNEKIVWVFQDAEYLEDRIRRVYVGGSRGVSVRIMRGVYYRVGAFKGETIDRMERVHVDTGTVVVTDKHIYFVGATKSVRIPYAKIVTFQPFDSGIGVMRDSAKAKVQLFVTGDGWFTFNLVTNLAQIQS